MAGWLAGWLAGRMAGIHKAEQRALPQWLTSSSLSNR